MFLHRSNKLSVAFQADWSRMAKVDLDRIGVMEKAEGVQDEVVDKQV